MPKTKTRPPPPSSATRRRVRLGRPVTNSGLERLRRRFEVFRSTNSRTAQIPVSLRKAVLAVLQEGVTRSAVQKSCGVSWTQMDQWQKLYRPLPRPHRARPVEPARVLSVVDGDRLPPGGVESSKQPLELRIGGWSISVRPIGGQQ